MRSASVSIPILDRIICVFIIASGKSQWSIVMLCGLLLQTEKHKDLSGATGERLECLADQGAGPVYSRTSDLDRHRLHREAFATAGNQQVANLDWSICRIDFHSHTASGGDQHFVFTLFAKCDSRLR